MLKLIRKLYGIIRQQKKLIEYLYSLLNEKTATLKPKPEAMVDKAYQKLVVDKLPIFGKPGIEKIYDYRDLIAERGIKPIKRRGKNQPAADIICPYCGATHEYVYNNNGAKGQYLCKVCGGTFFPLVPSKDCDPYCPYCGNKLDCTKKRKFFDVYRCPNLSCSYRQQKLSAMNSKQRTLYEQSPHLFKVRYIYRKFNLDFKPLSKDSPDMPLVPLSTIKASPHVLGLILTYHVNYALSLRMTAALMFDVHNVVISHQTIANYCHAVAPIVKPFVDHYDYNLSQSFCGDETYIKIGGKWHYIFFFFDAVKKIILSYRVQINRDYVSAVYAINDVLTKLKQLPKNLNLITDGNPIYLLAQHFFAGFDIHFDVTQVIGLTNDDPISKEFRPLKQIIERLNRTFKGNYKPTCGYGSTPGAIADVSLFVAYFNFLRPHSKLEGNVPVIIPQLHQAPNMPAKWIRLIELSQNFIDSYSIA